MKTMRIYDTTLRDGTQGENISFSADEKLAVARRLDEMGVHYVEGGWPGSNPRDMHFFDLARRETFQNTRLAAFGATRRPGAAVADDANVQALIASGAPAVAIFGKTWDLHVTQIMNNTLEENLAMIGDTVRYLKSHGREVIYDAEHFFDGFRADETYALKTLEAAAAAGADWIVLCDTNGGSMVYDVEAATGRVKAFIDQLELPCPPGIGIHTHNDSAMAVANAIVAVRAGAHMVHGTINGYGERCGNADLTALIPILKLKMGYDCISDANLARLKNLSRFVSETANQVPSSNRPFVGRSAFAHKGGIHVNAIMKNPRAYEHTSPDTVGNRRRVLISDLAGKSNVEYKARELGVALGGNGHDSRVIVDRIKALEEQGYQFDVADGSFKILVEKFTEQFRPLFDLESFRVSIEKNKDRPCSAHATIKIGVGDSEEITAAEGQGPVSALDNALRKALGRFFPDLDSMRLVDFKVRVIDGREGTEARVRVLIESRDQDEVWSTIGVSEDIIEASWQALADSFQYKLAKEQKSRAADRKKAAAG
ncbi:MAG: citramalate synthase [Desulfobacterales bacterium]|nr:citramalate synthase [Desulfobacterales bacterium]MDJ0855936.1 citramalate synthase [Desulfobacterales bacterium]MDJ0887861.1 citramalate synthase [Desulfobacterales bacterium]